MALTRSPRQLGRISCRGCTRLSILGFVGNNKRQICYRIGSNSLPSICKTETRSADCGEVLDCPPQHLEQDSSRPTEHQDAVHRSHRSFQPPFLYRRDVTVAKRGVIDEGKIEQIAAGGRRAYDAVRRCPDENLEHV